MAKEHGFCYVSFVVFSYENHVSDREKFFTLIETKNKNRRGVGVKSSVSIGYLDISWDLFNPKVSF